MSSKRKIANDVIGFAGISLIGAGLWQYDHRVALIVIGVIFLALAIVIGMRSGDSDVL
jgi:hypothetical protein